MATFVSKRRELRIVVKPADRTFDEARRPVIIRGERVEFHEYRFMTENPDLIDWLMHHPLHGKEFVCADVPPVPKPEPAMVQGSISTMANKEKTRPDETTYTAEREKVENPVTKDEIEVMIDQKMDAFMERMLGIVQSQAALKEEARAPKKVFTCPVAGCGMVFKSGIEVGKHKRLVHPTSANG
jgi:hypothetical protein